MELIQVKIKLYQLLLVKNVDDLTESEVDLMFTLSKDKDIQDKLSKG